MSTSTFLALGSIGTVVGGGIYALREYYIPMKNDRTRDRERIQELEEEIVRLKREMRICGIRITSEDSKIAPGK
jgi:hypothetical protein